MRLFLTILAISSSLVSTAYAQNQPDHNRPSCARNPQELNQTAETLARVNALGGVDGLKGTWKLSNIFAKATLSFDYDQNNFYVQSEDDVRETVSLCINETKPDWVRVSVHTPACPENKNVYIKSLGANRMALTSFATRSVGTVTFKKASNVPQPPGSPKPPVRCATY